MAEVGKCAFPMQRLKIFDRLTYCIISEQKTNQNFCLRLSVNISEIVRKIWRKRNSVAKVYKFASLMQRLKIFDFLKYCEVNSTFMYVFVKFPIYIVY